MTGPRDPRDDAPRPPDDEPSWPARDFDDPSGADGARFADGATVDSSPSESPSPSAGADPATDEPAGPQLWDVRRYGERRRPTTAEQAVPWLVGVVLALAGIVIVLMTLIFTEANGGFVGPSGSGSAALLPSPSASEPILPSPSGAQTPSASPTAQPTPAPTYGTLEMLYLSRPTALGASELFRDDFATTAAATVVARSSLDIGHYAVSPDGTKVVAIVNGKLLALTPGKPTRTLADGVDAVTFGPDAATVYAVKVTRGGANDDATIYAIGVASGTTGTLTTINFPHAAAQQRSALNTARFFDEGGTDRLYLTSDGNVVFWVSNGGQWRVDPVNGDTIPVARQPVLWSPDGTQRIAVTENGAISTLALVDASGATLSRVQVTGLLSHPRWSPKGDHVVFTLGINASSGGVRQDLYVWDLVNGKKPTQLTANGATFGAEWLGVAQFWQP